jgi:DNA-binding transcriptional MerR regulator
MDQLKEQTASEEPLYNIGAVARMTNIPMATLRIWERRYNFPQSGRTAGGHRLYSEKQVMQLRWVKARTDEGMQTGQAIRALQHLEREGRLPDVPLTATVPTRQKGSEATLTALKNRLTQAILAHDVDKADQVLGEAMALHPLDNLILNVIVPTLADIGQGWLDGQVTVATEHLATNYLRHRLLMWMHTGPTPYPIRPTMLACAPGELHEGSLLILGVLLRRKRWPVAYLGQSVPLPDLGNLIKEMRPPAVVLVAMTEASAQALMEWPTSLPGVLEARHPMMTFGGRIFTEQPEWRDKVPGIFLGPTLQDGLDSLDRLLHETT